MNSWTLIMIDLLLVMILTSMVYTGKHSSRGWFAAVTVLWTVMAIMITFRVC